MKHYKHYVYKLTDKTTNEYYYGSRSCKCEPNDDNYMGSMVTWKPNKSNLIKEILKSDFLDRDAAILFESNLISEHFKKPLNRNYYIPIIGFGGKPGQSTPLKGIKKPEFSGELNPFFGKRHSIETKRKISDSMKRKSWSGENNPYCGKKHTTEVRKKISESLMGSKHSDETKRKMSLAASRLDKSGYNLKQKKIMIIETGEVFGSIYAAAKSLGISRNTIKKYIGTRYKLITE